MTRYSKKNFLFNSIVTLYYSERYLTNSFAGLPMCLSDKELALILHRQFEKSLNRVELIETWIESKKLTAQRMPYPSRIVKEMGLIVKHLYNAKMTRKEIEKMLNNLDLYRAEQCKFLIAIAMDEKDDEAIKLLTYLDNSSIDESRNIN